MKTKGWLIILFMISIFIWLTSFTKTLAIGIPIQVIEISPFSILVLFSAGMIQIAGHLLRAWKSYMMIKLIRQTKIRTLFKAEAIGSLFNVLLPLRLGEFIRAHLVGQSLSISRAAVFLMIIAERIVDGYIISLAAFSLTFFIPHYLGRFYILICLIATSLLGGTMIFHIILYLIYRSDKWLLKLIYKFTDIFQERIKNRLRFIIWSCIFSLSVIVKRTPWFKYLSASVLMWILFFTSSAIIVTLTPSISPTINRIFTSSILPYLVAGTPLGPTYLHYYIDSYRSIIEGSIDHLPLLTFGYINWLILVIPISICGIALIAISRRPSKPVRSSIEVMRDKLTRDIDISQEFSNFLDTFFSGTHLSRALVENEVTEKYQLIKTFKGGSNALTVLVWQEQLMQVKKITLPQYKSKLIAQRDWLVARKHLPSLPRVTGWESKTNYFSFNIEYQEAYKPFFDFIHAEPIQESKKILAEVLRFVYTHIYFEQKKVKDTAKQLNMYIQDKILKKVRDTVALNVDISNLLEYESIIINGQRFDNLLQIIDKILKCPQAMQDLSRFNEGPIHGDLTIDNIIVDPDGSFIILDPNNENQVSDPVVDLAKLFQSLHSGYEFLCNLKKVQIIENQIRFEEAISNKYGDLFIYLEDELKKYTDESVRRSILFHEGVHYCRMLTYRTQIEKTTAAAFYAVAVRLFNEYFKQYEN